MPVLTHQCIAGGFPEAISVVKNCTGELSGIAREAAVPSVEQAMIDPFALDGHTRAPGSHRGRHPCGTGCGHLANERLDLFGSQARPCLLRGWVPTRACNSGHIRPARGRCFENGASTLDPRPAPLRG